jgi:hypothetical protein
MTTTIDSDNIDFWLQEHNNWPSKEYEPWYEYGTISNNDIKTTVTLNTPVFDADNLKTLISENHILNKYEKHYLCATINHLLYNCSDNNVNCIIVTRGKEQLLKCNFTNNINNSKVIYIKYETVVFKTYAGSLNSSFYTKRKRNVCIELVIGAFGFGFAFGYFVCKKLINV